MNTAAKSTPPPKLGTIRIFLLLDVFATFISLSYFVEFVQSKGGSADTANLLISFRSFCTMFSNPILGGLSDSWGRKPILLIIAAGICLSNVLEASFSSLIALVAARAVNGLTRAAPTVTNSMITDLISSSQERSAAMSMNGAFFGIGILGAVVAGGYLYKISFFIPAIFGAALAALNIYIVLFMVPETKVHSENKSKTKASPFAVVSVLMKQKDLVPLLIFHGMFQIVSVGIGMYTLELARIAHGADPSARALLMLTMGITAIVVMVNLLKISKLCGSEAMTAVVGCTLVIASSLVVPFVKGPLLIAAIAFNQAGSTMVPTITMGLISKRTPQELQGSVMGANESLVCLGNVIAPLLASALFPMGNSVPFVMVAVAFAFMLTFPSKFPKSEISEKKSN
jgi:DHA1 family tetracycline resistance protein-like MFS transporter